MTTRTKGRSCEGKRRNDTKDQALHQIATLVANRGARASSYRAYQCRWCGCWHVGHR